MKGKESTLLHLSKTGFNAVKEIQCQNPIESEQLSRALYLVLGRNNVISCNELYFVTIFF
jgi:hypothetical protein